MNTLENTTQTKITGEEILVGNCAVYTTQVQSVKIDFQLLTTEEKQRSERFHRREDRERYIATRCYIREIISNIIGVEASVIEFGKTEKGKPYLKNDGSVRFSISHSGSRIAVAVSKNYECGCDIEEIDASKISDDIINAHFHENEISFIKSNREIGFYHCWTRKEALYKAEGSGLPDKLSSVDSTAELVMVKGIKYQLNTFQLLDGYILSVAIRSNQEQGTTVQGE
jgi:4'-phosphopantetheinyl transferase